MNTIKFVIVVSVTLLIFGLISDTYAQEIKDSMYEDQVIVCVSGHVVGQKGNICHLYNADDLDWYQDSVDGSFFKLDDSFDMAVVD